MPSDTQAQPEYFEILKWGDLRENRGGGEFFKDNGAVFTFLRKIDKRGCHDGSGVNEMSFYG